VRAVLARACGGGGGGSGGGGGGAAPPHDQQQQQQQHRRHPSGYLASPANAAAFAAEVGARTAALVRAHARERGAPFGPGAGALAWKADLAALGDALEAGGGPAARKALAPLEKAAGLLVVPAAALPGLVADGGGDGGGGGGGASRGGGGLGLPWAAVCEAVAMRTDFKTAVLKAPAGAGGGGGGSGGGADIASLAAVFDVRAGEEGVRRWVV